MSRFPSVVCGLLLEQWSQTSHEPQGVIHQVLWLETSAFCCWGGLFCLQKMLQMLISQKTCWGWCFLVGVVGRMWYFLPSMGQGLVEVKIHLAWWTVFLVGIQTQRSLGFLPTELIVNSIALLSWPSPGSGGLYRQVPPACLSYVTSIVSIDKILALFCFSLWRRTLKERGDKHKLGIEMKINLSCGQVFLDRTHPTQLCSKSHDWYSQYPNNRTL